MDQLQMTLIANDRVADVRRQHAGFHGPAPEPRPLPPRRRPLAVASGLAAAWANFSRWVWAVEPIEPLAPTGSVAAIRPLGVEA